MDTTKLGVCFLYLWSAFAPSVMSARASLSIQLLNAKNGKPMKDERVLVFWGKTANDASKHLDNLAVITDANGVASVAVVPADLEWIQVWSDGNVICQQNPDKVFERSQINSAGVVEANTCGTNHATPIPNRLTLFARPYSFLEKMRR